MSECEESFGVKNPKIHIFFDYSYYFLLHISRNVEHTFHSRRYQI
jgi:hypothetical protein